MAMDSEQGETGVSHSDLGNNGMRISKKVHREKLGTPSRQLARALMWEHKVD